MRSQLDASLFMAFWNWGFYSLEQVHGWQLIAADPAVAPDGRSNWLQWIQSVKVPSHFDAESALQTMKSGLSNGQKYCLIASGCPSLCLRNTRICTSSILFINWFSNTWNTAVRCSCILVGWSSIAAAWTGWTFDAPRTASKWNHTMLEHFICYSTKQSTNYWPFSEL